MLKSILSIVLLYTSLVSSAQESCAIFGRVVNYHDEPLPMSEIRLSQNDSLLKTIQTDFDGQFMFKNLSAGTYNISVSNLGYTGEIMMNKKVLPYRNLDLGTIKLSPQEVLLKPIIYLYPEEKTKVNIQLDYKGELLFSYPKYPQNGWNVTAHPDGTLLKENGMEYYGLFWEGIPYKQLSIGDKGFVVKGEETVAFLEKSLSQLGLNRREAMEFIIFWQPKMEKNLYNLIHFSTGEYEDTARLKISPAPETIIRVMMVFQPIVEPIEIEPQDLSAMHKERRGFTVVEWGGTILQSHIADN